MCNPREGASDIPEDKRHELLIDMGTFLVEAAKARRENPRGDVLSILSTASIDGDMLSDAELVMFLIQLLVAGNETTRNLMSGLLVAFAEHQDQWRAVVEHPELLALAVEEGLRWTSPVISFMRTATKDTQVGNYLVRANEPVIVVFASANRDEDVFGPTANGFRVDRDPNPHVAFGFGNHFCLGSSLARLEARVLLEEMRERYRALNLVGPTCRSESSVVSGITRAEIVFS